MKKILVVGALLMCIISFGQNSTSMIDGTWVGKGYQFNSNKTWSIVLTIDNGEYSIDYASIPCKSELKLLEISANRVVFEEEIRKGICVRDGIVELEIIDSNSIIYKWSFSDGKPGAIAELCKF